MVTAPFLKQVHKNEKKLLKVNEVVPSNLPWYDEISVTSLYDECI